MFVNKQKEFEMHWLMTCIVLHITSSTLILLAPMLTTFHDFQWLCSSTVGCSMRVGPNDTHYASIKPLCKPDDLVQENIAFSCSGSRRCCTQCQRPLTISDGPTEVLPVTTTDELQDLFYTGAWIMGGVLVFELVVCIIIAFIRHAKKDTLKNHEEQSIIHMENMPAEETVAMVKGSLAGWRLAFAFCMLSESIVLATEMCLIIAMVLVPALPYIPRLYCVVYVVILFSTVLSVYCSLGLIVERYIMFSKQMYNRDSWIKTCACKTILSIMSVLMLLVVIAGFITASVYGIIAVTKSF